MHSDLPWWCLLAVATCSEAYDTYLLWRHRRRGEPVPAHLTRSVTNGAGFMLLISSFLVDKHTVLAYGMLAASAVCSIVSARMRFTAHRRAERVAPTSSDSVR